MNTPWKIATAAIGATALTALGSGLTTTYFLRPSSSTEARPSLVASIRGPQVAPEADRMSERRRAEVTYVRAARASTTTPSARAAVSERPASLAPAVGEEPSASASEAATARTSGEVVGPSQTVDAAAPAAASAPVTASVPSATTTPVAHATAPDCATGGDRAMRIAKPGAIGGLVGAGVGAIGGAIAHGGKGAGKGAVWGGVAGAAAGSAYGAYKTKQECGTIFGGGSSAPGTASSDRRVPSDQSPFPDRDGSQAPFAPFPAGTLDAPAVHADETITIYSAR